MKHIWITALALIGYLGLFNGHLAIYQDQNSAPSLVLPYRAQRYSQEDQAALLKGIPFESPNELIRLLQDFTS